MEVMVDHGVWGCVCSCMEEGQVAMEVVVVAPLVVSDGNSWMVQRFFLQVLCKLHFFFFLLIKVLWKLLVTTYYHNRLPYI